VQCLALEPADEHLGQLFSVGAQAQQAWPTPLRWLLGCTTRRPRRRRRSVRPRPLFDHGDVVALEEDAKAQRSSLGKSPVIDDEDEDPWEASDVVGADPWDDEPPF